MTSSIKRGSPLRSEAFWSYKIKKYIKDKLFIYRLEYIAFVTDFAVYTKFKELAALIIDITTTGLVIYYIMNNTNFASYGLAALMLTYYLDKIVQIVKTPYKEVKESD